ncbi:MAG: CRTAC1 family protein, partial [Bradymonadaceae bacterium]
VLCGASLVVSCSTSPQRQAKNESDVVVEPDVAFEVDVLELPDLCQEGTYWEPGMRAFEETTAGRGLDGAEGVRLSVTDIDGDGLPDLVVRRAGLHVDDFSEDGTRAVWLLRNLGDGQFEDVTRASGLVQRRDGDTTRGRPAEVVVWADVNNNGHLDALTLFTNPDSSNLLDHGAEVMLNDGTGSFDFGPISNALQREGARVSRSGAAFIDVNRDGHVDLWLGQGNLSGAGPQQDLLFQGNGTGAFTDITTTAGLSTEAWTSGDILNEARGHSNAWSVAACDLTGNGSPELLAASYGRAPNHLWLGSMAGEFPTYENHSIASGYAFDHRVDWSDNESARCYCKFNREAPGCADVPEPAYVRCDSINDVLRWNHDSDRQAYRLGGNSGTTVCADINNDGHMDLLTTEIVHWDVGSTSDPSEILYNTGEEPLRFDRPGNEATGLTRERSGVTFDDGDITAAVFDFDNDGRLDILIASTDYPGTRALLYHQQRDGTFRPVPVDLGVDLTSAHGVAVADFNTNGALDLVIGHSRFRCGSGDHCLDEPHVRYFENAIGQNGNWVQFKLEGGPDTNRAAIGARITLTTEEGTQTREVGGGHGHYGIQHDLTQHFGLGPACTAEVTIRWPDKDLTEQTFTIQSGYRYQVRQGEAPRVD